MGLDALDRSIVLETRRGLISPSQGQTRVPAAATADRVRNKGRRLGGRLTRNDL